MAHHRLASGQTLVGRSRAIPLVWIFLAAGCCGDRTGDRVGTGPGSEVAFDLAAGSQDASAPIGWSGAEWSGGQGAEGAPSIEEGASEGAPSAGSVREDSRQSPSRPEESEIRGQESDLSSLATRSPDEVLLSAVPLEFVGGLDLGRVELCYVRDQSGEYLRFDAEFSGDRAPLTLLFPVEGGVEILADDATPAPARAGDAPTRRIAIRGYDDASVPFELPASGLLHNVSATYYVFSVVVELEHVDGRLDVLDVGLDWDGWDIDASLLYRRYGPAWMGLFGRETLAAVGPIQARLDRVDDVGARRLWIGRTERGVAASADAAP